MDNSNVPMRKKSSFRAGLQSEAQNVVLQGALKTFPLLYGVIFILDKVKQLNQTREDN